MRGQCPGLSSTLNRLVWRQGSLKTAMIFPAYNVKIASCKRSREIAREVSSIAARVWYTVGMEERERVLEWDEVVHCSVLYWQELGADGRDDFDWCRHKFQVREKKKRSELGKVSRRVVTGYGGKA